MLPRCPINSDFFGDTAGGTALFTSSSPVLYEFEGSQICSSVYKRPPEVRAEEAAWGAQLQKAHPAPELRSARCRLLKLFPFRGAKCLRRGEFNLLNNLP